MPVYQHGNSFSDSPFGPNGEQLATAIRALTVGNRRRRVGRLLDPPGSPEPIGAERTTVPRDQNETAQTGGGLVSPITEQLYTGADYFLKTSTCGFFVIEYPEETDWKDAVGTDEKRVHNSNN